MKVSQSAPQPIRYYREKQLETKVTCNTCALKFAIYGVFGWCPDCGAHNSLQILSKNLELAHKQLALAATVEAELGEHLIGDALENIVSAFDGFGREVCSKKLPNIRFQNQTAARRQVQDKLGFDFADGFDIETWATAVRIFQKRHLLAHKMSVIDAEYVQKANDPHAVEGRKVRVSSEEVSQAVGIVEQLGRRLVQGISASQ